MDDELYISELQERIDTLEDALKSVDTFVRSSGALIEYTPDHRDRILKVIEDAKDA